MLRSTRTIPRGDRRPLLGGRRRRSRLASEAGFTLIEVLVAAIVLAIGITALFALVDNSVKASFQTRAREGATSLARQVLEDAHTIPYSQMSPTSITEQLQSMGGLKPKQVPPAAWQVVQRGITYTVKVSECAIDDPKNGWGKHLNSAGENPFCKDPGEKEWVSTEATEGKTEDPLPENLKRITVDVTWVAKGRSPLVREVETLTAAGEAVGPSAFNLKLSQPLVLPQTAPLITEAAVTQLVFTVSAPKGTTAIVWSLEGNRQSPAPTETESNGTGWTFTWPITGLSDGTYKVTAQAVNATGVVGPPDTIAVTLIRGAPAAPSGIQGGFNTVNVVNKPERVVELQWHANAERNVIGYRVYNPSGTLVCPKTLTELSLAVTCTDFNPPGSTQPNLTYKIAALYHQAEAPKNEKLSENVSEGPAASFTVVGGEPPPAGPNPAEKLNLVKNADGSVTLSWSAPKSGGEVSFYRIYRGSTNYASRYDVTGATTYTDTDATEEHSYWVTAVNSKLTESAILGPVKG
jgi:prepilin-type N-terminal cleavage/methylation domain-containing protein